MEVKRDKKKKTKNTKKRSKKSFGLFITLLIVLLLLCFMKFIPSLASYKVDTRIDKLKTFTEEHTDLDVAGWLKVQGTNIDYPILSTFDNIEYAEDGIQYLWENGDLSQLNRINYILGHNVMNLSSNPLITNKDHVRFEQLLSFTYPKFVEKNKYVQLTIGEEEYVFKIFSVSYPSANAKSFYNDNYKDNEDVKQLIDESLENSIFDFDIDVNENDTIISLITCTRMFGLSDKRNFVVDARLVREGESTRNYKVTESKKFSQVKEKMKGDTSKNEEI